MPHVSIKLAAGRSEEQKQQLSDAIVETVAAQLKLGSESISVALEDVPMQDWMTRVYIPELVPQWERLYKKPGYGPGPETTEP